MSRTDRTIDREAGLVKILFALIVLLALVVGAMWVGANAYAAHWIATHGRSDEAPGPPPPGTTDVVYSAGLHAWYTPPRAGKATIVMVHGFQANLAGHIAAGNALRSAGYGTLQIELGADRGAAKYGGGGREAQEVAAGVAFAKAQTGGGRVGLLGFSAGGTASLLAAGNLAAGNSAVIGVVADSSPVGFVRLATDRARIPRWLFALTPVLYPHFSNGGHLEDLAADIGRNSAYSVPTLIIQGTADKTVDPSNGPALAALTHGQLWVVPGAGHTAASTVQPDEYLRRLEALYK